MNTATLVAKRSVRHDPRPAPVVKRFLDYIFLECGLAGETVTAYQRDLREFWDDLVAADVEPEEISVEDVQRHLIGLQRRGLAISSIARHFACIKVFLRHLHAERVLRRDVTALLESPRRWRTIPDTIHYDQVENLLRAPDPAEEFYLRDVALLELLYATGMRVSEVAGLTLDQINLKLGYVRCIGKGRKERIIPVGRMAIEAVSDYVDTLRSRLLGTGPLPLRGDLPFPNRASAGPHEHLAFGPQVCPAGGDRGSTIPAYSPALLRHASARQGGADLRVVQELLGHADVTTTPDIHPRRRRATQAHPHQVPPQTVGQVESGGSLL